MSAKLPIPTHPTLHRFANQGVPTKHTSSTIHRQGPPMGLALQLALPDFMQTISLASVPLHAPSHYPAHLFTLTQSLITVWLPALQDISGK